MWLSRSSFQAKAVLEGQVKQLEDENKQLKFDFEEFEAKLKNTIAEKNTMDVELQVLKEIISTKKSEMDRELRAKEKLEMSLKQATDFLAKKDNEIQTKILETKQLRDQIVLFENLLREEKAKYDKAELEKDSLGNKFTRIQQEYEEQVMTLTRLITENQQQSSNIKELEETLLRSKEEVRSLQRVKESLNRKYKSLEDDKNELDVEKDKLKVSFLFINSFLS